jgi:hypothetical protein
MANTKAVHLKNFKKFVIQEGGEDAYDRVLELLAPADREIASKPRVTTEWLDCGVWWRMLVAADRVLGQGDLQWIRRMGAFDARESLHGVYRIFLSLLQPSVIINRCGVIWRQYYDTGHLRPEKMEKGYAEVRLTDFAGLPLHHEIELLGWMEEAIRLTGTKTVEVMHPGPCLARGDKYCSFVVRWK